jgi:putative ABC transport system permease protein
MIHDWWYINSTNSIYVELKNGVNPKHIESDISKMQMKIKDFAKFYHFFMLPLSEVHFDGRFAGLIQKSLLIALGAVGLLLILISCINFINIALAQSLKRAKEIGTRKVLGGTPFLIFLQFITETALITLFAAFFSFAAVLLCLPILNTWLGTQLIFNFISDYPLIVFVFFLLLLVILAAGIYPGLILSRFKPILAIKNQIGNQTPNSGFTQKGLIILQNTLAQIMIISTLLISLQVKYLKTADLGFNKSAILMLPIPDYAKNKTNYLRNLLLANPNIKNVSFCYQAPISTADKSGSIKIEGRDWEKFVGYTMFGDANYIKTFGIQLIAGRNLIESDTSKEFLLNELLVKKLGFKDPKNILGRRFIAGDASDRSGVIVGVVKDFHSKSLYSAIRPEYITTARDWYKNLGIKIGSINHLDLMNIIQKDWKSVYPDHVFEYRFLDEQIADYYNNEDLLNKLISSSAILAIFISCLGLTGLISLLIVHRTKEIGIRKVLGASISSISLLLSRDTLKWVLVAGVIASPLAWIIMSQYLQNFAYRIQIPGWVFVLTGIVALLIAFLTISFQSIKAAKANPIISLRSGE